MGPLEGGCSVGSMDQEMEPQNQLMGGMLHWGEGDCGGGAWEVTLAKAFLLPDSQVLHTCGEC